MDAPIRKDVRDLITVNEKLQSALAQGESLTDDEAGIIRMCANELLAKLSARPDGGVSTGDSHIDGQQNFSPQPSPNH